MYLESLEPQKWQDVDTFAGHKWMFIRTGSEERLIGNNRSVWVGEPWTNHAARDRSTARRIIVTISTPGQSSTL